MLCGFGFDPFPPHFDQEGSISLARKQKKQKPDRPIPKDGFLWCYYLLGNHFFRFFGMNLITVLCCASVVLAPAGISAACRACAMLLRGKSGLFWEEYREEFKANFLKKLLCWAMMLMVPVGLGLWTYILGFGAKVTEWAIYILLAVSFLLQVYWFNLISLVDLPLGTNVKNAVLLLILEWKTTVVFGVVLATVTAGVYFLFPYSLVVLFSALLSAMILLISQQCQRIFTRRGLLLPREVKQDSDAAAQPRQKG